MVTRGNDMKTAAVAGVAGGAGGLRLSWRKSSHSNQDGACVEMAEPAGEVVLFRDSKAPDGSVMRAGRPAAAAFAQAVRLEQL